MFYLFYKGHYDNAWHLECKSNKFNNLKVVACNLLYEGYTIKVDYIEEGLLND